MTKENTNDIKNALLLRQRLFTMLRVTIGWSSSSER